MPLPFASLWFVYFVTFVAFGAFGAFGVRHRAMARGACAAARYR